MERLDALIKKYQAGTATPEECALVERHFLDTMEHQPIPSNDAAKRAVFDRLDKRYGLRKGHSVFRLPWAKYTTAAAVAIALSISLYFFVFHADRPREIAATEILPGGNRATLTLADGHTIDLSEAQAGIVVGGEIIYTDGSEVIDAGKESLVSDVPHLMSLTTPKGGTYQITLPDGSNVWLNAGSTLTYPTRFSAEERVVELTGEAYFDIAPKKLARELNGASLVPFLVKTNNQVVEVLGTQFNISAYADEPETRTTLVEGSVKVAVIGDTQAGLKTKDYLLKTKILSPREQSIVHNGNISINEVDVKKYIAWKDGMFAFDDEPLESIMRKVARWYDVTVRYEPGVDKAETYGGNFSRFENVSSVLRKLQLTGGIHFNIEGRTIIISK